LLSSPDDPLDVRKRGTHVFQNNVVLNVLNSCFFMQDTLFVLCEKDQNKKDLFYILKDLLQNKKSCKTLPSSLI